MSLPVSGSSVEFKIDTGADITIMSQTTFNHQLQSTRLVRTRGGAVSPGGKVHCIGKFLASSQYKGQKSPFWVTVISGLFAQNLLGRSVAKRLGILMMKLDAVNT